MALRRLLAECKQMQKNPPEGISAGPVSEDNYFEWEAAITGPEGCPFEDGVFIARMSFPDDYPLTPPRMKFVSKIFHPNIYPDGRVRAFERVSDHVSQSDCVLRRTSRLSPMDR